MRVLILSQYYAPEPIPKPGDLAAALRGQGHDVYVITGFPDYPKGVLYDGYRLRLLQQESIDGIPVIRTFEFPYHGTNAIGRFLNYLSFMLSAPLALLRIPAIDVMYVWHPPLTVGVAAWVIAKARGIRFVYDVQDIWPESAILSGVLKPGGIVRLLSLLEKVIYKVSDHVIVVTDGAKKNLMAKGVPDAKISTLPHWVDDLAFETADMGAAASIRERYGWKDKFVVLFAGNLGLVQGLDTVVEAATQLRDSDDIRFVFLGDGSDRDRLRGLASTRLLNRTVQFIDRQPATDMPNWMAAADALLVHLKDSELSNYIIPSKTMSYLASGRPIIMAMNGAAADIVQEARAGVRVPPESATALANAIVALKDTDVSARARLGENGRRFLKDNFSSRSVIPKYIDLLARLAT